MNMSNAKSMYIPVARRLGIKQTGSAGPVLGKFPIANQLTKEILT